MALEYVNTVLLELSRTLASVDPKNVEQLKDMIAASKAVFCHGAGRSGLNAKAFAMRLMHLGMRACVVGDVVTPPIAEGDLLLVVTASGSSPSMACIVNKARDRGAKIAVLTTNPNCPISAVADCTICMNAPTKAEEGSERKSVMPMGTLFEEACYVMLDILVLELMEKLNITNSDMVRNHANLE